MLIPELLPLKPKNADPAKPIHMKKKNAQEAWSSWHRLPMSWDPFVKLLEMR
jgi:hypothetical protein